MPKKITIKDIAEKAGVSKSTVSKALGYATDINDITRERVLFCASELGYEVKKYKTQSKGNVITFVEGIDYENVNQFGYELILGFQAAATEAQYGVNIVSIKNTDKLSSKYEDIMHSGDYCGSFLLGFKPHDDFVRSIKNVAIPAVALDNHYDSELVARVGSNSNVGITLVMNHLYGLGHRVMAYVGGEADSDVTIERKRAFLRFLADHDLLWSDTNITYSGFYGDVAPANVLAIATSGVTAFVCASDIIATNVIRELTRHGFRIPLDISVTGYDDIPLAKYSVPSLTTVCQSRVNIGRCAFYALLQLINDVKINKIVLRPELVTRDSTAVVTIGRGEFPR